jgi:hypothetical protein
MLTYAGGSSRSAGRLEAVESRNSQKNSKSPSYSARMNDERRGGGGGGGQLSRSRLERGGGTHTQMYGRDDINDLQTRQSHGKDYDLTLGTKMSNWYLT